MWSCSWKLPPQIWKTIGLKYFHLDRRQSKRGLLDPADDGKAMRRRSVAKDNESSEYLVINSGKRLAYSDIMIPYKIWARGT